MADVLAEGSGCQRPLRRCLRLEGQAAAAAGAALCHPDMHGRTT